MILLRSRRISRRSLRKLTRKLTIRSTLLSWLPSPKIPRNRTLAQELHRNAKLPLRRRNRRSLRPLMVRKIALPQVAPFSTTAWKNRLVSRRRLLLIRFFVSLRMVRLVKARLRVLKILMDYRSQSLPRKKLNWEVKLNKSSSWNPITSHLP